jgi:cytochrome c-type biogenesis protein CcmH/NrfG
MGSLGDVFPIDQILMRNRLSSATKKISGSACVWRVLCLILLALSLASSWACAAAVPVLDRASLDRKSAERALMIGHIDESVAALQRLVADNPKDGAAYLLLCRAYFAEDHMDEAVGACESAVTLMPHQSETLDWMGRAYGLKADHAGPLDGFRLARKVKLAFEAAVESDPGNGAAVNDLSEYYIGAPSIVGGGLDKADALANRFASTLPQQAHRIRALAAMRRKDYGTAEREFQSAVDVARRPEAWSDLGGFYAHQNQQDRAIEALRHCIAADPARDAAVVDAASILNGMHTEQRLVILTLQQYLAGSARSDAAPAAKVHVMLGKILADAGDAQGARVEFGRALELASNYGPARKALEQKQRG